MMQKHHIRDLSVHMKKCSVASVIHVQKIIFAPCSVQQYGFCKYQTIQTLSNPHQITFTLAPMGM